MEYELMNNQKVVWRVLLAAATVVGALWAVAESEQSETSDTALSQCIEEANISGAARASIEEACSASGDEVVACSAKVSGQLAEQGMLRNDAKEALIQCLSGLVSR